MIIVPDSIAEADYFVLQVVPREHNDGEIIHIALFVGTRFIART